MTNTELRRLSELRAMLEGFAARHAASHATPEARQPELLRAILRRLNRAVRQRDYPAFRAADEELHATVVAAADVPRLLEVWRVVWGGLQGFHQKGFEECFPDVRILIEEHEHLVETVAQGDPAAAEDAARAAGKTLLDLDTATGSDAERLYQRAGWVRVGDVPGFALWPDGRPCSTTYYYRSLA